MAGRLAQRAPDLQQSGKKGGKIQGCKNCLYRLHKQGMHKAEPHATSLGAEASSPAENVEFRHATSMWLQTGSRGSGVLNNKFWLANKKAIS